MGETVDGCVCAHGPDGVEMCGESQPDTRFKCTRPTGHDGPHVACGSETAYRDDPASHRYAEWGGEDG